MPKIDPRPFGGPSYAGGVYGNPANPLEWQHQPGDHSDTGILPLLTPVSATAGVSFGFSVAANGEQTFSGTAAVTFGFSLAATGTAGATEPTVFCDYDYADDTYDNPADTYDCGAVVSTGGDRRRYRVRAPLPADDDEDEALALYVLAARFRR